MQKELQETTNVNDDTDTIQNFSVDLIAEINKNNVFY